ncbi:MAG: PBP1A family penicillin-binding protein [Candidatus Berkelbacteria bacterium]
MKSRLFKKFKFTNHKSSLSRTFKKKRSWKEVARRTGLVLVYLLIALIFCTAAAFAWFSKDLPTPSKIAGRKPAVSTKIYDRTGQILLFETGEQKRTIIKSNQISQYLKDATVSIEDAKFYEHHGIDFKQIAAAVAEKLLGRTKVTRGASTITQQYVKNALLTSDRSITRKIKEAILAVELEFMYNKDEILTMYLNEIPYGNGTAGAEAAAKMYYDKTAEDLTLAQAATLAAIPQSPTYYSPYGTHVDALIARRNHVLDQMVKNGKITEEEAAKAKVEDTTTVGLVVKPRRDSILAPHFAMYVLEQIANQYGDDQIQKEGLNIITTLDYDKQKLAEKAVADGVPKNTKYGATNAALVATDPKNGQVLAMVGSKDYFDNTIDGQVNVADSLRQPGSSFKPFAYATAFKSPDYSPSKIIFDLKTDFGGTPPYTPQNYNGKTNGPVTMRQALSNSLNIPAVKVMALAGIDNVLQTASDMGITTLTHRADYGLSLVLGAGEVRPVEMANAFAVFATGGIKHPLTSVLKITDSNNKTLFEYDATKDKNEQALDPQIAYELASIMSDNNARSLVFGTRSALAFSNRTVAAKTGTTSDFKDAWTVGYTPSISVAVWVGNSNGDKMKSGADGSVVAAPIFHSFVVGALGDTPNEEFTRPAGIQDVTVEKWSNKLPDTGSTEMTTDIFTSWQAPKEKDDVHKKVRVCKGTNNLAPDNAPATVVEEKIVTVIHSEKPDNPNWENPVMAWATENGMVSNMPTGTCDFASLLPTISIVSPTNNAVVSGSADITATAGGANPIAKVEYFIDGISIGDVVAAPYNLTYDFSLLADGSHKISAIATDSQGTTGSTEVTVTTKDLNPLTISQTTMKSLDATSEDVTWMTDKESTSTLTYYPEGTTTPILVQSAEQTLLHKVTLSNLLPNKKYFLSIRAVDTDGNVATSETLSFTTPVSTP